MRAIAKTRPGPGVEIIDVPEPQPGPGEVKVRLEAASVCGTDLHIYSWDSWSASRILPPRVIGHEFCGTIVELGAEVQERHIGQFVSSESHIVCGHCRQCLNGQAHVCVNTRILGVDIDGGFANFVCIPFQNAVPTDRAIPPHIACFQDALGNAVHTVNAGPVEGCSILITGMGPIGMMAVTVAKALGAKQVIGTEISPMRRALAQAVGVDAVIDPSSGDTLAAIMDLAPGGFDAVLEMSGHGSQLELASSAVRPGGRISMLGVFADSIQSVDVNRIIFSGVVVQGIVGRRLWETWDAMGSLLRKGKLNLGPIVTHHMHYTQFAEAMELMKAGSAGKVTFHFGE